MNEISEELDSLVNIDNLRMINMQFDLFQRRLHFYYCFIVSIKIREREQRGLSNFERYCFMLKWISDAQAKGLFHQDVKVEIEWLKKEIMNGTDTEKSMFLVEKIYNELERLRTTIEYKQ